MAEPVVVNNIQVVTQAIAELDKILMDNGWERSDDIHLRQNINGYDVKLIVDPPSN